MIRGLRSRLNKLLTGASRPTSPRTGTGIRFRPVIEGLEDRAVPTVAPYAVASVFDSAVYVFDANTGNIESTLVAPNSQSILANPAGMTVGPDGNLYFGSQGNESIVKYDVTTHALSTFIDSSVLHPIGTANGDVAFAPAGLRFGPDGSLYVALNGGRQATSGGAVVRFGIDNSGGQLSYHVGSATTIATGLVQPTEMAFGNGFGNQKTLFVSNSGISDPAQYANTPHNVVCITDPDGANPVTSVFIATDSNVLNYPAGLVWGPDGGLFVVDLGATTGVGKVVRFNADGSFDRVFSQPPTSLLYAFPTDAVFDPQGNLLTANLGTSQTTPYSGTITKFDATGTLAQALVSSSQFANGIGSTQLAVYVGNKAPTVAVGGPYTIAEGTNLTLAATATDADGDTLTYTWDLNGDGIYGDASGANPTLTWAQLNALGITDGQATRQIKVHVDDNHGHLVEAAPGTLTVTNAAPTLTLGGAASVNEGAAYSLALSATDAGADTITGWTITWGDGQVQQVTGNPASVTHTYAAGHQQYTISATATDEDGTFPAANTRAVSVELTGTQNEQAVKALYFELLSRAGDPTAVNYWSTRLNSGESLNVVVEGLLKSDEYLTGQLNQLYQNDLGRTADTAGLAFFKNAVRSGMSWQDVEKTLVSSPEFQARANASGLLPALYQAVLNRGIDAGALTYWQNYLNQGGTVPGLVTALQQSQEFSTGTVNDLYLTYLGRTGDAAGLAFFSAQLQNGISTQAVLLSLLSSAEFYAQA